MQRLLAMLVSFACLAAAPAARATFHTFVVEELYTNADGSVQYVVLHENSGFNGQDLFAGHALTSTGPAGTKVFVFPNNLPGSNTAGRRVLIATPGFAALGLVTPNYVIPNGFVPMTAGTVDFAGVSSLSYAALPTDGTNALYRGGSVAPNLATNFAGQSASVSAPPPPAPNFQGIWWKSPAGSESGWGINLAHQGDTIFASWFTYDAKGRGWWLVMTAQKVGTNRYQGKLFETHGPAFDAVPFLPGNVVAGEVGTGTLSFTDANNGTFDYTVSKGGIVTTQSKAITRQVFGPLPACAFSASANPAAATNFQDLWWAKPAASESGWGVNLNHQGDTIFATWFTYDHDGTPLWLVVTAQKVAAVAPGVYGEPGPAAVGQPTYTGDLFRTTGPAFSAPNFDPAQVVATKVGTATFAFADGNNATFDYTVKLDDMPGPVHQVKSITRELFGAGATVCQ